MRCNINSVRFTLLTDEGQARTTLIVVTGDQRTEHVVACLSDETVRVVKSLEDQVDEGLSDVGVKQTAAPTYHRLQATVGMGTSAGVRVLGNVCMFVLEFMFVNYNYKYAILYKKCIIYVNE